MPDVQLVTEATNGGAEIVQFVLEKAEQNKAFFRIDAIVEVVQAYEGENAKVPGKHENLPALAYTFYAAIHIMNSED